MVLLRTYCVSETVHWYFYKFTMCQKLFIVPLRAYYVSETACGTFEDLLCVTYSPQHFWKATMCQVLFRAFSRLCHGVQGTLEKLARAKHGGACLQSSAPETETGVSVHSRPALATRWVPGYSLSYRMRLEEGEFAMCQSLSRALWSDPHLRQESLHSEWIRAYLWMGGM